MTTPKPSIGMLKRLLGAELLRLREATGLKQHEAAQHLGKAPNKISRVETGQIGIDKTDLTSLLALYDAPEKDSVWCRHLASLSRARRGRPPKETTLYAAVKWFRAFRNFESDASEIMNFYSEIITGIMQTEAYTRAMFAAHGFEPTDQRIEDVVRARAERRQILIRDAPPKFSFVLSESALRRQFGGAAVMADQLRHLAEMALLPNVTTQVVPFDAESYEPMSYAFTVFRFGRDMGDDIVYMEMYNDAIYLDKPPETVAWYSTLFGKLQGIALGPVESRNLILELADQFAGRLTRRDIDDGAGH